MRMSITGSRNVFINLPVKDLEKSVAFFENLGFAFNSNFTDENATAMIINEDAYVMLLVRPFFKTFTTKEICDTSTHSQVLIALSCTSRGEVDELIETALKGGGKVAMETMDQGFMYVRSFYDLDGHHWELAWMEEEED